MICADFRFYGAEIPANEVFCSFGWSKINFKGKLGVLSSIHTWQSTLYLCRQLSLLSVLVSGEHSNHHRYHFSHHVHQSWQRYAEPILTVYGSGDIMLMVGTTIVELEGISGNIVINSIFAGSLLGHYPDERTHER